MVDQNPVSPCEAPAFPTELWRLSVKRESLEVSQTISTYLCTSPVIDTLLKGYLKCLPKCTVYFSNSVSLLNLGKSNNKLLCYVFWVCSLQKQFEQEHQVKTAKESLKATVENGGTLGDTEFLTTAHGEEQPVPVPNLHQAGGNLTTNATNIPDDAANSTSTLVSCTVGRETVGQPVEVHLC